MCGIKVNTGADLAALIVSALNSADMLIWLKALHADEYAYISPALVQLYQDFASECSLMKEGPWSKLLEAEEFALLCNDYEKVVHRQLKKGSHRFKILTQAKITRWFEEEFLLVEAPADAAIYLVGIARDITEVVNREEGLYEASIYFAKLAEKSEDVFWVRSADYKKQIYVSPSFEVVWGRSVSELYHHPERWDDYLYPEDQKRLADKILEERNIDADYAGKFYENYRIVRPNGELRYIMDCSFPIFSRKNELLGFAGIARDVTETVLYEQALRKAKEQAEAANEAKTTFLLNMSHDLRTPFSGILSMSSFLHKNEQDPLKKEMQGLVLGSAKQLLALLNDVLEISKLGSHPVCKEHFNLKEVVEEVCQLMSAEVKMKNLTFKLSCANVLVNTDKHRLTRILLNLIGNAIKFTHQGWIKIEVRVSSQLELIVQDSGIGIPQDKLEIIFDKFSKISPSNKHTTYMGSGLGLYIVKQFAQDLKGSIWVESKLGEGSNFKVIIPLH